MDDDLLESQEEKLQLCNGAQPMNRSSDVGTRGLYTPATLTPILIGQNIVCPTWILAFFSLGNILLSLPKREPRFLIRPPGLYTNWNSYNIPPSIQSNSHSKESIFLIISIHSKEKLMKACVEYQYLVISVKAGNIQFWIHAKFLWWFYFTGKIPNWILAQILVPTIN